MRTSGLTRSLWYCALAASGTFAMSQVRAEPLNLSERTVSSSRQFIIYANEYEWRNGVATVSEETKRWLLGKLRLRDDWKHPVVVSIERASVALPSRPISTLRLFETEIGPKIQLDLLAGPTDVPVSLRKEILRTLLAELSIRNLTGKIPPHPSLPGWLITGLANLQENEENSSQATFYEALLLSGTLPVFDEFIRKDPSVMDTTSLKVYKAYAGALVQSLLDMPDGRTGLVAFIQKRALDPDTEYADLQASFPPVSGEAGGLEKWWSLGLARLSTGARHESRRAEVTAEQLAELLKIVIADKSGEKRTYALAEFKKFEKFPDTKRAMTSVLAHLSQFGATANPLFVPLVEAYAEIVRQIAVGKTKGLGERIAETDKLFEQTRRMGSDVTDYLNWFEATQIKVNSGDFRHYLRAARQGPPPPPKRPDAISRYLDSIEMELE